MVTRLLLRIPLQPIIAIPFVIQLLVAVGLVGWLSFRNGQQAVNDVALQLRREISQSIQWRLHDYLAIPHLLNQVNANAVRTGELKMQDTASEYFLWQQIQLLEGASWIYFGAQQDGAFIGATRINESELQLVINDPSTEFQGLYYSFDAQGRRLEQVNLVPDSYDARTRPWYQLAAETANPAWSAIYPDFGSPQLILSAVAPVHNNKGDLLGVVGADFSLDDIGDFLQSLQIGKTGKAFVMERSGLLVASSILEAPYRLDGAGEATQRIEATASDDRLIAATAEHLVQTGYGHIEDDTQLEFLFDGALHFVGVDALNDTNGLDWLIVGVIPEADFLDQIHANNRTTVLLCLIALFVAIVVGLLTARWVTAPILQLNSATKAIAEADMTQSVSVNRFAEVNELGSSFNNMAGQLDILIHNLEEKVAERTAELATANQEIQALNEQLKEENLRLSAEIAVTRQLQQMILPNPDELKAVNGLDIAGFMEAADEVGGDYYDVLIANDAVKIGIGDVTDHGLESGVVMLMTQTAVRTLLNSGETDPVRFLDVLNRTVYGNVQRMNTDRNLTLSLLDYRHIGARGEMRLSGQHEEMIVVRKDGRVEIVDTSDLGFPIGLDDDVADFFSHTTVELASGDGIVLFTDGITEAENLANEQYGMGRLCQVVSEQWTGSAEVIKESIIEDVRQHIGQQEVFDDITLVVAKQT
ncbi:SpoIIE family protein phosphatase [Chloroflexi bacterium TSY]|nr:SpoIIE family protein phosphatase [Chloroflexi bacterium TSY]